MATDIPFFRTTSFRWLLLSVAGAAFFFCIQLFTIPTPASDIRISDGDSEQKNLASFPFSAPSGNDPLTFTFSVPIRPFDARIFRITPDDCVTTFLVNGVRLSPFCTYGQPTDINLRPWLHSGINSVTITVRDVHKTSMGLAFFPSPRSLLQVILRMMSMLMLLPGLAVVFLHFRGTDKLPLLPILIPGMLLQLLYRIVTSADIRSYDMDAHIEYIRFVATHFSLPPPTGWETHQAPLYYVLTSPFLLAAKALKLPETFGLEAMQDLSVFLSSISLALIILILERGLAARSERSAGLIVAASVACFAGLVMTASRISNDALSLVVALLFASALIAFWERRTRRWLWIASGTIALGFITKTSSYLFLPVLWTCILCMRDVTWRRKGMWCVQSLVIIGLLVGWYPALRLMQQGMAHFEFGSSILKNDPRLAVPQTLSAFLTFHPIDIVRFPFASSRIVSLGKNYFWIYFFKTALFGEFDYPRVLLPTARMLALTALGMLPIIGTGIVQSLRLRHRHAVPMTILAAFLLMGAIAFRVLFPFSPTQDFRLSTLLILPAAYFVLRALATLRGNAGIAARIWTIAFTIASALFLLQLIMISV